MSIRLYAAGVEALGAREGEEFARVMPGGDLAGLAGSAIGADHKNKDVDND